MESCYTEFLRLRYPLRPAVCAIVSKLGFDWLYIDAGHHLFNLEVLRTILVSLRDRETAAIVRLGFVDEALVKPLLDWGAEGIMFPFIRTLAIRW